MKTNLMLVGFLLAGSTLAGSPAHAASMDCCKDDAACVCCKDGCENCADCPCCKGGKNPQPGGDEACHHNLARPAGRAAHGSGHEGHMMTAPAPMSAMNASSRAYMQGMDAMHKKMAITYTGDADIDFLKGMIPHHQGAVEMAKVQLQYGRDAQVKRLAREVIRAQNREIDWMEKRLEQLEARGVQISDDKAKPGRFDDSLWLGDGKWEQ